MTLNLSILDIKLTNYSITAYCAVQASTAAAAINAVATLYLIYLAYYFLAIPMACAAIITCAARSFIHQSSGESQTVVNAIQSTLSNSSNATKPFASEAQCLSQGLKNLNLNQLKDRLRSAKRNTSTLKKVTQTFLQRRHQLDMVLKKVEAKCELLKRWALQLTTEQIDEIPLQYAQQLFVALSKIKELQRNATEQEIDEALTETRPAIEHTSHRATLNNSKPTPLGA